MFGRWCQVGNEFLAGSSVIFIIRCMEALTMAWIFDRRWVFGLPNPFNEFLFLFPIVGNAVTIAGILMLKQQSQIQFGTILILLLAANGLLIVASAFMLLKIFIASRSQLDDLAANQGEITEFIHRLYQAKQTIWNWPGLVTILLSIGQIVINDLFIKEMNSIADSTASKIRFWVDIGCWAYLGLLILIFLVCKISFLLVSWKCPQFYLGYRQILD